MAVSALHSGITNPQAQAVVDFINSGSGTTTGRFQFRNGANTALVACIFASPAMGSVVGGVSSIPAAISGVVANAGTAISGEIINRSAIIGLKCTAGTSGQDAVMTNNVLAVNDVVVINTLSWTQ